MEKTTIGIIFGGKSGEHEVSLMSAASVIRAIDKEKYDLIYIGITKQGEWKLFKGDVSEIENGSWANTARDIGISDIKDLIDFALPIVHGPYCEDGKLQGVFEMLDIPYGGCGVLASAVCMDKLIAKDIFRKVGLPICKHVLLTEKKIMADVEGSIDKVEEAIGYPNFVKPANMGSSVGISKATDRKSLRDALMLALKYDRRIICEEAIDARELETGVLGNEDPEVAEVGEILSGDEFYDYRAKYTDGISKLSIPADITPEQREEIRTIASKAYRAVDGEGFARCDFFIERSTGKVYINEINTIPGFTKYSMFPLLWEAAGVQYSDVIERIIELGYERYNSKNDR